MAYTKTISNIHMYIFAVPRGDISDWCAVRRSATGIVFPTIYPVAVGTELLVYIAVRVFVYDSVFFFIFLFYFIRTVISLIYIYAYIVFFSYSESSL